MGYYMNDCELGCIYMYLSGLHFIHVLYGIIILGTSSNTMHSLIVISVSFFSHEEDGISWIFISPAWTVVGFFQISAKHGGGSLEL